MNYEIKTIEGNIIFAGEYESLKECVEKAVESCADLSGADLLCADLSRANLFCADLSRANLFRANLSRANLSGADLSRANLSGADLSGANLFCADLSRADLFCANLFCAIGLIKERVNQLLFLYDQPGKIRLYKLVTSDYKSPFNNVQLEYPVGKIVKVKNANSDDALLCEAGINVATLNWCLMNYSQGNRILIVEFTAKDIACIPTCTDGKLRLHKCKVVGEKDLTGLVEVNK
jgi:hypothetical protein